MLEGIIDALLNRLKDIVTSETVVGKPIQVGETTVIPITKISLGFGAGAGSADSKDKGNASGTGGGAVIEPIAIITVSRDEVKIHRLKSNEVGLGKVFEALPELIAKFTKPKDGKKRKTE
ncbi:MAG: sporulation protein [Candidatus Marinimicrobia bacterium CG08_land_8_20_14_0_20_45_22]|nr:MAG: sporulation protein [Candidatus Marinimicrobia bacterium CG08_land_8_20_14_0_20_45_22]